MCENYSKLLDDFKDATERSWAAAAAAAPAGQNAFVVANFFHQKFRFSIRLLVAAAAAASALWQQQQQQQQ